MTKFTQTVSTADSDLKSGFGQSLNAKQREFLAVHEVMEDKRRKVSLPTFRRHCAGVNEWAQEHGYAVGKERGLHLDSDCCVQVYHSIFNGSPCYYLDWSCHQFIWTQD